MLLALGVDRPITTSPGALSPLRLGVKRLVRKAIRWELAGIVAELNRAELVREAERAESKATIAELRRELAALRDRLGRVERGGAVPRVASPQVAAPAVAQPTPGDPQANLDYFAFEALMRGSTEEIAERQSRYVAYFDDVDDILDVGCGRGELLVQLAAAGKRVRGVDVNADMVAKCVEQGLRVELGDGSTFLAAQPDGAFGGIVALQVVEHLTPTQLVTFLEGCRRTLRSGGVLVLETINPASLSALRNYFADLTHRQPLVPETLAFLAETAGFRDVRIEYLNPLPEIARLRHVPYGDRVGEGVQAASDRNVDLVNATLFGPQDFVVIARA